MSPQARVVRRAGEHGGESQTALSASADTEPIIPGFRRSTAARRLDRYADARRGAAITLRAARRRAARRPDR